MKKRTLNIKKLFTILVVLLPILDIYAFPLQASIGIGDFLFLLCFPIFLFGLKGKMERNPYIIYVIAFYCLSLFSILVLQYSSFSISKIILRMFRDLFYVVIGIIFSSSCLDKDYFKKLYEKLALINCLCIYIQSFFYYFMKKAFFLIIPNQILLGNTASNLIIESRIEHAGYGNFMPSSVFLERGDFAWYILPYIVLCLFDGNDKKYGRAIFATIALGLTTSASGLIGLVCVWGFCLIKFLLHWKKKRKDINFFTIGGIAGAGCAAILLAYTNVGIRIYYRVKEVLDGIDGMRLSSGYMRVLKGFELYSDLPLPYQIFGVGAGNLESFARTHSELLVKYNEVGMLEYMSGMSYILVSGGIFSLLLFLFVMWHFYRNGNELAKAMVLLTVVTLCISSFYASPFYVIYLVFICFWQRKRIGAVNFIKGEKKIGYSGQLCK